MSSQTLRTGTGKHSGPTAEPPAHKPSAGTCRPAARTVGRYAALAVAAALTLGPVLWTLSPHTANAVGIIQPAAVLPAHQP